MIRLTPSQINKKIDFIQNYIKAGNAASASSVDANANWCEEKLQVFLMKRPQMSMFAR